MALVSDPDPAPEDTERVVGLLTDPDVGLGAAAARELAGRYGFETVLAQVMRFVRDRTAGQVRSPFVL
jgi:hypothetical protein